MLPNLGVLSIHRIPTKARDEKMQKCGEGCADASITDFLPADIMGQILLKTDVLDPDRVKKALLTLCKTSPDACSEAVWKAMVEELLGRPLLDSFKKKYCTFTPGLPETWLDDFAAQLLSVHSSQVHSFF